MGSEDTVERLVQNWGGPVTAFAEWLHSLVCHWERRHGCELSAQRLVELPTEAGCVVRDGYARQLLAGHRGAPSQLVKDGLASVFGVSGSHFDTTAEVLGVDSGDLDLLAILSDTGLRRLSTACHGLSAQSQSLLIEMAGRLRTVEGRHMVTEY
ncbi:hypothetical protein [Nocardia sp. NPDC003183]